MAFRRRTVRRAPARRRFRRVARRVIRRRYRRRRRVRRTGNITVSATSLAIIAVPGKGGMYYDVAPSLANFEELEPFTKLYEAYRIVSISVKVIPLFNVTTDAAPIPRYYSAPWHRPGPTNLNSNAIVTLDGCKSYNGYQSSFRRYVPAVMRSIGYVGHDNNYGEIAWRPRIELNSNSQTLPHYCGLYVFSADQAGPGTGSRQYEIETKAKVVFYNQKNFAG